MLTQGEDVEVHALKERGWSITAIANHLGHDRKTIRAYLKGERTPGVRARSAPDPLEPFVPYLTQRLLDDPHVWASALFDEVVALGYSLSYPSFARQVRLARLRPHCEACAGVKGRDTVEIAHPAGEEIQWDWFERRRTPWGATLYVLLGTLAHSSRVHGVICESMDQAHLIEAMDTVMRKLGGTTRDWRVDRLATVIVPGTRDVQLIRPRRQALRRRGGTLSTATGKSQGSGRIIGAFRVGTLVAHDDRGRPRGCAALPRPVL